MKLSSKTQALAALLSLLADSGWAQGAGANGPQPNHAISYDQAACENMWYQFVNTTNDLPNYKYQNMFTIPLLLMDPLAVKLSDGVLTTFMPATRADQREFFYATNRPFILDWAPDYLSFYKANNSFYGKSEADQLSGLYPSAQHQNNDFSLRQLDEFDRRTAFERQKEVIHNLWQNARPLLPDSEVVYFGSGIPLEYDFDKHQVPFNIFAMASDLSAPFILGGPGARKAVENKEGRHVCFGRFPVAWSVSEKSPLNELLVFTFNGQPEMPTGLPMGEEDARKFLKGFKDDTLGGMSVIYYAINGKLVLSPQAYDTVRCKQLAWMLSRSDVPALWKVYVFDVSSVDFYEFQQKKRKLVKIFTLSGANYQPPNF